MTKSFACKTCGRTVTADYAIERYRARGYGFCSSKCSGAHIAANALARTAARFWPRVDKKASGCWEFNGPLTAAGYPTFNWRAPWLTRPMPHTAHRVAWFLTHGQRPPVGKEICHSCDNPKCCNPHHLWVGTHEENMHDMAKKGRSAQAKIDRDAARQIKNSKRPTSELAQEYGLAPVTIRQIRSGRYWRHV